jgi:WXG100 family type VII secretion target
MSPSSQMGQSDGALSAAAVRVAEARRDFDHLDRELRQHLDAARASWTGRGAAAFHGLGLAWSQRQQTIVRALDDFEGSLRATEQDNVATDESQSSVFASAQRRLG